MWLLNIIKIVCRNLVFASEIKKNSFFFCILIFVIVLLIFSFWGGVLYNYVTDNIKLWQLWSQFSTQTKGILVKYLTLKIEPRVNFPPGQLLFFVADSCKILTRDKYFTLLTLKKRTSKTVFGLSSTYVYTIIVKTNYCTLNSRKGLNKFRK